MTRAQAIFSLADCPADADDARRVALSTLFDTLFPGHPTPAFDHNHAGMAVAAQSPALALALSQASTFMAVSMPFSQRRDLRELVIQMVNQRLGCDYSFSARKPVAEAAGISAAIQADLPDWRTSALFDDEKRLVAGFAEAVVAGSMDDELYAQAVERFGHQGAVELSALAAFFGFWAMFINATGAGRE